MKFYVQVKFTILRKKKVAVPKRKTTPSRKGKRRSHHSQLIKWQFQKEKQHHPEKAREDLITRSWQLTQLNVKIVENSSLHIMFVILAGITTEKKSLIKLNLVKILI